MPSREEIIAHLKSSYDVDETRSLSGQIRVLIDDIDELQDGGMSLSSIADALTRQGIKIGATTLTNYLWRIRTKRKKANESAARKKEAAPVSRAAAQPRSADILPPTNPSTQRPVLSGDLKSREDFAKQFENDEAGASGPLGKYRKQFTKEQ